MEVGPAAERDIVKAQSFSHVGLTVSNFNKAVQFYWDVFGCPLVGVADTPPDRVRSFFKVDGAQPSCKIGWIRVPGGATLEIFEFQPQLAAVPVPGIRSGSRTSASTSEIPTGGTST